MTTKEIIEVLTAFENGQEIEAQRKCSDNSANWLEATSPSWDFYTCNFRIKPKPKVTLRFLTINELWGKTLIKENGDMFIVTEWYSKHDYIGRNNNRYTISQLDYSGWKLAGPDLNYETATRLEVEA